MQVRQRRRDLNDLELGTLVHLVIGVANEIQDIQHHRAVARAHLVDNQVVVRVQCELVIRDEIPRNCLAIIWPEQFCRRMPQLPPDVRIHLVESVFELGVALAQEPEEGGSVFYVVEVEWFARAEDGRVFGEVAVMWVVEAVYSDNVREEYLLGVGLKKLTIDEFAGQHFDLARPLAPMPQFLGCDRRV